MKIAAIHLSVAFGIASVTAHAQGTNDPVTQLRACSVLEQAERLECLDKLSRNIAPLPRQPPAVMSHSESAFVVALRPSP